MTTIRNPRGQARAAAVAIEEATVAIADATGAMETAFRAIEEAAGASLDAGFSYSPELTPELGTAYRRWLDRPDNTATGALTDPLDRIPAFLRPAS